MKFDLKREADRLFRIISDNPGITRSQLFNHSQNVTSDERGDCLRLLISLGRIREAPYKKGRGPAGICYWPIEQDAPQAPQPSQLAAAVADVQTAQRQLQAATASLELALKRLGDLQAKPAEDAVASVQGLYTGVQTMQTGQDVSLAV